jgi:glucosamine 6-phosphate synthetase-like amidotransferase/phosphosugar isomerase protein
MQIILQTLLTGLRRLEYRGYDSAGLAVTEPATNKVTRLISTSSTPLLTPNADLGAARGGQR